MPTKVAPPKEGTYFTDGTLLVQMVGLDDNGYCCLEDAKRPADEEANVIKCRPERFDGQWFTLEEWERRKRDGT